MDHQYKVVVYGEDYCPYCTKVKQLFNGLEIQFDYRLRSQYQSEFQALSQKYKHTTIPLVLVNDKFIGGCSDVQTQLSNGSLIKLLGI